MRPNSLLHSRALSNLDRRGLAAVGAGSLVASVLLFALPLYSLQVFDRVLTSRSTDTLWLLTLITALALAVAAAIDTVRARLLLRIGNAHALALGPRLLEASILLSARSSAPETQGQRDLMTLRSFVTGAQGLVTFFDAPLVPVFLVAVYLLHPVLGHVMLFGIVLLLVLALLSETMTGEPLRTASEAGLLAQRRVDGVMHSAEAVEAMGMRSAMRTYWATAQGTALAGSSVAGDRSAALAGLAKGIRLLLNVALSFTSAWLAIHDEITMGGMVASGILAARGLAPLESLVGAWKHLVAARLAATRLNDLLARVPAGTDSTALPPPAGTLALEKLVYVPPGADQPTIRGVNLSLPAGQCLGLIGPSGAGKSTLARLICGVWVPRSGHVRLDGADVTAWPREDFGRHCGYLPQEVALFAGSIRDNIARFGAGSRDEDVVLAAQRAGCHEMILRLPKGYDTQVGAGGATLSGGQRQRIGLARALFGEPRLLVLDEPNANLDTEGEAALLQALAWAKSAGVTTVVVSHRPSLLAGADWLVVLVEGQVQQFGLRDEVLARVQPRMTGQVAG